MLGPLWNLSGEELCRLTSGMPRACSDFQRSTALHDSLDPDNKLAYRLLVASSEPGEDPRDTRATSI